jgi:hypothetical protein
MSLEECKQARSARRAERARQALFVKLQGASVRRPEWSENLLSRRIAQMTDAQVSAALAMSEDEIKAATLQQDRWAPATGKDGGATILWDHP